MVGKSRPSLGEPRRLVTDAVMKKELAILAKMYPDAHCELDYASPFQLLIATILSAQTTDVTVNQVTPALFAAYPTPQALAAAAPTDVEQLIYKTGFFRNKAKSIIGTAKMLVEKFNGVVPDTMDEMLELPGVARKTANVVLGNAYHKSYGIAVDTHVTRLSQRLGMTLEQDPKKIELELMQRFPKSQWTIAGHRLIWHGRRVCFAKKPDCARCPLNTVCPTAPYYLKDLKKKG